MKADINVVWSHKQEKGVYNSIFFFLSFFIFSFFHFSFSICPLFSWIPQITEEHSIKGWSKSTKQGVAVVQAKVGRAEAGLSV